MVEFAEVETARIKFARLMQTFVKEGGRYHQRAPIVPQRLLENCKVFEDRYKLLEYLPKKGVVAEVGTDRGDFARRIFDVCEPTSLHIFELDPSRINAANIEKEVADKRCQVVEGDSSSNIAAYPDKFFDWIYIDGDHHYEGVKKDIEASASKIKDDGMLVFNDYATWSPVGMTHCGVARAVNEFCLANDFEFVYFAFQNMMYNDVAIRKAAA